MVVICTHIHAQITRTQRYIYIYTYIHIHTSMPIMDRVYFVEIAAITTINLATYMLSEIYFIHKHFVGGEMGKCLHICTESKKKLRRVKSQFFSNSAMMTLSNGKISALLAISAGNSPVPGEFPAQRPVTSKWCYSSTASSSLCRPYLTN